MYLIIFSMAIDLAVFANSTDQLQQYTEFASMAAGREFLGATKYQLDGQVADRRQHWSYSRDTNYKVDSLSVNHLNLVRTCANLGPIKCLQQQ